MYSIKYWKIRKGKGHFCRRSESSQNMYSNYYWKSQRQKANFVKLEPWKGTCLPTVRRSHTNAHNAIMHLQKQAIWEITWKHTPCKSQINASGVTTPQSQNQTLPLICLPTVGRSHTSAHNAIMHLHKQVLLIDTSKHIPYWTKSMQMVRLLHNPMIKPCPTFAHPHWREATSL